MAGCRGTGSTSWLWATERRTRLLDITPLVDSVEVLEVLVEGAPSVNFVIGDVLDENTFDIGGWQVQIAFLHDIFPAEAL